jgi:hypothetical protein
MWRIGWAPNSIPIYSYIQKDATLHSLYLETALHVSGGNSIHHQERIQLYLQHLLFVTPLLHSAVILDELELVWVCCGWRTPPTAHSNPFLQSSIKPNSFSTVPMHHGMSPIKPSIPTYTSRTSARFFGNGQLPIARPWTRTQTLIEPLVHPPNNRRLKRRWTFDEIQ